MTVAELRAIARRLDRDHGLATALWATGIHEARILATIVADPDRLTRTRADAWTRDVDSWDLCDQLCGNLVGRTPWALDAALAWSRRDEGFVRRAGLALMAYAPVHRKDLPDERFEAFLPAIRAGALDDRNAVMKGVSWALRQIGTRSRSLHRAALATARDIERLEGRSARWIARDVRPELESELVRDRLHYSSRSAGASARS